MTVGPARLGTRYRWNAAAGRYVDGTTGRFVPRSDVTRALGRVVERQQGRIAGLTLQMQAGTLDIGAWQSRMARELRLAHAAAAAAGAGGWAQMTPAHRAEAEKRLRFQLDRLDRFARQIEAGVQPPDGRMLARSRMYARAARATYEEVGRAVARGAGMTQERNILGIADHCGGCLEEDDRGWVELGALVPIGGRTCLANCGCSLEFREPGEVDGEGEAEVDGEEPLRGTARLLAERLDEDGVTGAAARTIDATRLALRDRTAATGNETAALFDLETGELVGPLVEGETARVPGAQVARQFEGAPKGREYLHLHTHPNSSPPSDTDGVFLLADAEPFYRRMRGILVQGADGTVYSLSRIPGQGRLQSETTTTRGMLGPVPEAPGERLRRRWGEIERATRAARDARVEAAWRRQGLTGDELARFEARAWRDQLHAVWQTIAPEFGLRYERIARGDLLAAAFADE